MSNSYTTENSNLSIAWAEGLLQLMRPGVTELAPLIVTVTDIDGNDPAERVEVRRALDQALGPQRGSCSTVANTIFPRSLWNPARDRSVLYERYIEHAWPRIRKCPANRRGTYFQRMIAFENGAAQPVNQLEHIISTWIRGNHRHSALQLSVFDPRHDHNHCRQMGFPCLHQVCFTPIGINGAEGLGVTGFYATQHMFEKAYGNYLGLCRLGHFVAHELKLRLVRMTCIAASAKLGKVNKSQLEPLAAQLGSMLDDTQHS